MGEAMVRALLSLPVLICCHALFALTVFFTLLNWSSSMAFFLRALLFGSLTSSVASQSTITANPEHSGVPTPYPNPYLGNNQNHSWYNGPNSPLTNATDFNGRPIYET